ncbi:MAG: hypothetical protein IPI27_05505 [Betaproteobacteria bacterium]|nr:hypothetical protein [Betaproteobacteria bacterium]
MPEKLAGLRQEHAAEVGRHDATLASVEELDAGSSFELLDAARERRLGEVLGARGAGEAAFFGQGARVPEQPKVEIHARMLSNA